MISCSSDQEKIEKVDQENLTAEYDNVVQTSNMSRNELVKTIAAKSGLTEAKADSFLNAFIETVTEELQNGGSVSLVGFGSFKVVNRPARDARNPRTGEKIRIPARKAPVFRAGKDLKEAVKQVGISIDTSGNKVF
jgi:DNA-binding protein HU-beta